MLITRRLLLPAATGLLVKAKLGWAQDSPNNKLNIAQIGVGGRGAEHHPEFAGENVTVLCDVDARSLEAAAARFPKAAKFRDYRLMFEKASKSFDAVVVTTPDHHHAPATAAALRLKKHVYTEKPLTHSIHEARLLTKLAAEAGVATQMGNQGHADEGPRRAAEIVAAGDLGPVHQIYAWCNRPIWPQGIDRPPGSDPVPATMDWDLWLGPAPERPYKEGIYHPLKWRGWWDFGTGALGDMACHILDPAFFALKLGYPISVEAIGGPRKLETGPKWETITIDYPARGEMPPVTVTWYDGVLQDGTRNLPPAELAPGIDMNEIITGSLFVGEKGSLCLLRAYGEKFVMLPKEKFKDYKPPAPTIPRSPGHHQEWFEACKGRGRTQSSFAYAGPFTEMVLIGVVAFRAGKKLVWDPAEGRAKNAPEADAYIRRDYRNGWIL